jgi:hypothetical protein
MEAVGLVTVSDRRSIRSIGCYSFSDLGPGRGDGAAQEARHGDIIMANNYLVHAAVPLARPDHRAWQSPRAQVAL